MKVLASACILVVFGIGSAKAQSPVPKSPSVPLDQRLLQRFPPQKPTIVCGMTLIPADPKIDPRIHIEPPARSPKPLIRTIAPEMCRAAQGVHPPAPPTRR